MRESLKAAWKRALMKTELENKEALFLRTQNGFSAIGILCELYRQTTGNGEWVGYPYLPQAFLGQAVKMPDAVREWAGLAPIELDMLTKKSFEEVSVWLSTRKVVVYKQKISPRLLLLPPLKHQ